MNKVLKFWGLLAALLSGVALALCFPGYDIDSLVWVWAMPLMAALWLGVGGRRLKRRGFLLGWIGGFVFWSINLVWLKSMGDLDGVPPAAAMFAWLGLAAYLALFFGIWGAVLASVGNPWRLKLISNSRGDTQKKSRIQQRVDEKLAAAEGKSAKSLGKKRFNLMGGFGTSMRVMKFALMHASLWVVLEWLRGWLFTGFGWNGLGIPLHGNGTISQAADLVGVIGISFLPMLVCSMFVQLAKRLIDEARVGKFTAHWEIPLTIGLVALTFMYGVQRISHFKNVETIPVSVLLLQENIPQSLKWGDEAQQEVNYLSYADSLDKGLVKLKELSLKRALESIKDAPETFSLKEIVLDVVIMPESSFTQGINYLGSTDQVYLGGMDENFLKQHLLAKGDFSVIFGSNYYEGEVYESGAGGGEMVGRKARGRDFNALLIADPQAQLEQGNPFQKISAYSKVHLVPFGEYYPTFPGSATIYKFFIGAVPPGSFAVGDSFEPLQLNVREHQIAVIPAVCFEDTVGRVTRKFVRAEPQMIVNITNDGWFGESIAARQHMSNALFRCIELRRPMARAANTGMSGIVDMTGSFTDVVTKQRQVVEDENGNIFIRASLFGYARVPVDAEWTLYAMFGDWFVILCFIIFTATLVLTKLKSRKEDRREA